MYVYECNLDGFLKEHGDHKLIEKESDKVVGLKMRACTWAR